MGCTASNPEENLVKKALRNRFKVHRSGAIIKFDKSCAWKDHIHDLEKQCGIDNKIKFVLWYDKGCWNVQSVTIEPSSSVGRNPLKEEWIGRSSFDLGEVTGDLEIHYVHPSGFSGFARNYESALKMATLSLIYSQEHISNFHGSHYIFT